MCVPPKVVLATIMKGDAKSHQVCADFDLTVGAEGFLQQDFPKTVRALVTIAKCAAGDRSQANTTQVEELDNAKKEVNASARFGVAWDVFLGMVNWASALATYTKQVETRRVLIDGFSKLMDKVPQTKKLDPKVDHDTTVRCVKAILGTPLIKPDRTLESPVPALGR